MSLDTEKLAGPYKTVFDVGAFQGDFARACHAAWPEAHVHCFEPLLPNPDETPAASSEAFVGWASWHEAAVGANPGTVTINSCEFIPSSSMLRMTDLHKQAFPYTRRHNSRMVYMVTLDEYADLLVADDARPALLKIDVQGYEREVLRGAQQLLDWISAVVLEVSWRELYVGAPNFETLNDMLTQAGFMWAWRVDELRHPKSNDLLQSDELWLR